MSKQAIIQKLRKAIKAHSLKIEFTGANRWRVTSDEKVYALEAFFGGYDSRTSHGYKINIDCKCEAGRFSRDCVHAAKVRAAYDNDHSKLFPLFGLDIPQPIRFAPLWEKAREVSDRLEANSFQQMAA